MLPKNKKGVSLMIGYIFLITTAIILSTIVYKQLSTYVPKESIECPEGVSISIDNLVYDCSAKTIDLTIRNSGRFDIAGYFISASDSPNETIATNDISPYTEFGSGGVVLLDLFTGKNNPVSPGEKVLSNFDISSASFGQIYSIDLIPVRYQDIENKNKIVSCTNGRITQKVGCYSGEAPAVYQCNDGIDNDNDNLTDYPNDPGCSSAVDNNEEDSVPSVQCSDGTDNDNDGLIDYPNDPGCTDSNDDNETDTPSSPTLQTIAFIGCEDNTVEEAKWHDDASFAGTLGCLTNAELGDATARTGSYSLAMSGNFNPNLDLWNRSIDLSGYTNVSLTFYSSTEDTEPSDRLLFYYWNGSSWVLISENTNRNSNSQTAWVQSSVQIPDSAATSNFEFRVAWETSSNTEHMLLDDLNVTGYA